MKTIEFASAPGGAAKHAEKQEAALASHYNPQRGVADAAASVAVISWQPDSSP